MKTNYVHSDGTPVQEGNCVKADHQLVTVTMQVRSTGYVSPERIKSIVEGQHEVTKCELQDHTVVVK